MTDHETTQSVGIPSPPDAPAQATAQVTAQRPYTRATQPRFKKKRFAFAPAIFVLFLIIMVSTGGNDPGIFDRTTSALESQAESSVGVSPQMATTGESVRDGKFSFTVTSVGRPSRTITDRLGISETAQGVFVIVRVSVTNIGYDPRTLTATDQYLAGNKGQRFATSSAISSLAGAETIFAEKINPGHTVHDAPVLFDVPPGTTIASIELHDSVSSKGVKVALS